MRTQLLRICRACETCFTMPGSCETRVCDCSSPVPACTVTSFHIGYHTPCSRFIACQFENKDLSFSSSTQAVIMLWCYSGAALIWSHQVKVVTHVCKACSDLALLQTCQLFHSMSASLSFICYGKRGQPMPEPMHIVLQDIVTARI